MCWIRISVSVCVSLCFHQFGQCSGPVLQETGMHQVVVDRALVLASSALAMFVICHFGHVIGTRLFGYLIKSTT